MGNPARQSGPGDLTDKVIIVTGASRGIGKATAVALGELGASVVCAARATSKNQLPLPGTVDETANEVNAAGGKALAVGCDLSQMEDLDRLLGETIHNFDKLDMLINNAAITFPGDMDIPAKRFDLIMRLNVRAPLVLTQLARPHLAKSDCARVLNVSSVAAVGYFQHMMAYGMSKQALEHLTVSSAAILADEQIAVNAYRIDVPVASEGYLFNDPDGDHSSWYDTEVAAEGMIWMLRQPDSYTGQIEAMSALAHRENIMKSVQKNPVVVPGGSAMIKDAGGDAA